MADVTKIIAESGKSFNFEVDRAGKATLATSGKYVDRNIDVTVPAAVVNLTATGTKGETVNPIVSSTVVVDENGTFEKSNTITTTVPTTDKYITITPKVSQKSSGSSKVTVTSDTAITKAGFISATEGSHASGADVDITGIDVEGLTNTTSLYLPVNTVSENNISGQTSLIAGEGGTKDNFSVTLTLPAGYYDEQTVTKDFSDLLPALEEDATDSNILFGKTAYDENGNVITGTMTNNSDHPPVCTQVGTGSTSIVGTSVTLSETSTESGLKIEAAGTTSAKASIDSTGYYVEETESLTKEITTSKNTRYITDINITSGNTLNSVTTDGTGKITTVTNGGSIGKLAGIGTIDELSGTQTISDLTGTINITKSTDEDEEAAGTQGKVIFGGVTIVQDGDLIRGEVQEVAGGYTLTKGWIDQNQDLSLTVGEYKVKCAKTNPSVTLKADSANVDLVTAGEYAITLSSDSITKGSHQATATITKGGYLAKDSSLSTIAEDIDVTVNSATVYLEASKTSQGLGTEKYADNADVSKYYEFSATKGYTDAGVKETIDVFDGSFSWA